MRAELLDVFARSKFDSRINLERRLSFLQNYLRFAVPIHPTISVHDCVDVKDNKFLECALAGEADIILSGDDHLLRLHPWRGIPIITPAAYLMLRPGDGLRGTQL
jgi:putative PIN family toxin of toxin-antitoxin system